MAAPTRLSTLALVTVIEILFWAALAALAGRTRLPGLRRTARARCGAGPCGAADFEPTVAVIVAAYNEEAVIERRIENLLALDYPPEQAPDRRHLRRVDRPHGGDRARSTPGVR